MKTSFLNNFTSKLSKNQLMIGLLLLSIMYLTRASHFGSAFKLPDASLAVFFLAGLYLRQWRWFPAYMLMACAIDYVVIQFQGVSSFCVTQAYVFLVPTYAAMWFAGRAVRDYTLALRWINLVPIASWALAATLVAFFISNTSFYFLSGYVQDFDLMQYLNTFVLYLPRYLKFSLMYLGLAAIVHVLVRLIAGVPQHDKGRSPSSPSQ